MGSKIWRQNYPKLRDLDESKLSEMDEKEFTQYLQADVNSQLSWIALRSCVGIKCKECYMKKYCTTKNPADSQALAASVIKTATRGKKK